MDRFWCWGLLLLWFVASAIAAESASDKVKRDVHRIIIKSSRKPRSHRHHHHHHKGRGHSHGHKHQYRDDSKESFEDSRYYDDSREDSYEDIPKFKPSRLKPKPKHRQPAFSQALDFAEPLESFKDEWTPLVSAENKVLYHHRIPSHSYEPHGKRRKRKEKHRRPYRHHHEIISENPAQFIDLTTSYPQKYPSLYESTDFPPYVPDVFSNFNQKIIDSKQSPIIRSVGILPNVGQNRFISDPNFNTSYSVHEVQNHDRKNPQEEQTSFNVLAPAIAALSGTHVAPETKEEKQVNFRKEEKGDKKKPPARGRFRVKS